MVARRKHPGAANSLDALCARYGIDSSRRKKHGALLDAELLAEVYVELSGGRQSAFSLQTVEIRVERISLDLLAERSAPLKPRLTREDIAAHEAFVAAIGEKAFWRKVGSGVLR